MSLGPIGMNSGMDINSMVSKIVEAERLPKQQRINNEQTKIDSNISAYGRLRESLDTMRNLMTNFRQEKAFAARRVETSNDGVVSATATTEAIAGRYAIDVLQLAQSHKVASDVLPEDAKFGPGKLQISMGERDFTVDVRNNSRLIDIVRGINNSNSNPGVRASVINDMQGPRLIVAANLPGEDNQVGIRVDAAKGDNLNRFEYKTLEQRVRDLEKARNQAQELLAPLSPEEQKVADEIANRNVEAAKSADQQLASSAEQAALQTDPTAGSEMSESALAAAAKAGTEANRYLKPEERIPGWTETASGTLLDSYQEPEPELDEKALEKSQQVPGWTNTASGTLTDSYVTPQEAQQALEVQLEAERDAINRAIKAGDLTEEEAKQAVRAQLPEEQRAYLERVDKAKQDLDSAQDAFDAYQGMIQVQAGQNSEVLLDGIAKLSSNNNVIEDAIEGVNLTLKGKTDPNQPASEIDVEYDREGVRQDIEQFVASYNQFHQVAKELGGVDPRTGAAGPLAGDSVVRSAESRLKTVLSTSIDTAPPDLKSLTEFGITTTRRGDLEINYNMLNKQLNNNFTKMADFFGGNQGFAKQVEDAIQSMTGVTGSIRTRERSMVERNHRLQDEQANLDRRMESIEQRTHAKFSAMQDATSKMQSQLAGMMNALG
ncbi:flagellar filament capping protein FliD [Vibrio sp. AK197]